MQIITAQEIERLHISPVQCVKWVREVFEMKDRCQLPPKVSLHPKGIDFFNTMPCLLPSEFKTFGCKIVSRIAGTHPPLKSEIMLFNTRNGKMEALLNADWITAMRTGAVAALAINTLRHKNACIFSFIGLGVIGRATLDCLLETNQDRSLSIRLMKYKDQAEKILNEYSKKYPHIFFEIVDTIEEFVSGADVIVSCVTEAKDLLVKDTKLFKPGVLVVPVHTRGFQNCDTIFDKIFADDQGHVRGFKYFNQFKKFGELSDVLSGKIPGRETEKEQILSYNVGIGIFDIFFAYKILQLIND